MRASRHAFLALLFLLAPFSGGCAHPKVMIKEIPYQFYSPESERGSIFVTVIPPLKLGEGDQPLMLAIDGRPHFIPQGSQENDEHVYQIRVRNVPKGKHRIGLISMAKEYKAAWDETAVTGMEDGHVTFEMKEGHSSSAASAGQQDSTMQMIQSFTGALGGMRR
ncbi:MAG: hypothetical protein HY897_04895 [Deltaproteobacteria bacterium]|nr:hypothetical protein [Deltaproteobacteria bacterium]